MTNEDRDLLRVGSDYIGPTLSDAPDLLEKMGRVPLCAVCPAAQWYVLDDDPQCFCTQYRGIMYGSKERIVTACDARTDVIEREIANGTS